jgi:hypothetical protein
VWAVGTRAFGVIAGESSLHFGNEAIYIREKAGTAGVRTSRDDFRCTLGKSILAGEPCPTPYITVADRRKPPQVVAAACVLKVSEEIFEAKPKALRKRNHGAVQHNGGD